MARTRTCAPLALQSLEDRLAPATFTATAIGGTLIVTQTSAAVGPISITDNPALGTVTMYDLGDSSGPVFFSTSGRPNLAVRLRPEDATVAEYLLNSDRAGSVSLSLRNIGDRALTLSTGGAIVGSLTVTGGNGGLTITESLVPLNVGGNATFRGGAGSDTLDLSGVYDTSVGGALTAVRFNTVSSVLDTVGRLSFNAAGEATPNVVTLSDIQVLGSLTYVGGTRSDSLLLNSTVGLGSRVTGDVRFSFGTQGGSDLSECETTVLTNVGGRLSITGSALGGEHVTLTGTVNGAVGINLSGGLNIASLIGIFDSPTIGYVGGSGVDDITYSPVDGSARLRFSARLGAGADGFKLDTRAASTSSVFIDFGSGVDLFNFTHNPMIDFPCQFLNLP